MWSRLRCMIETAFPPPPSPSRSKSLPSRPSSAAKPQSSCLQFRIKEGVALTRFDLKLVHRDECHREKRQRPRPRSRRAIRGPFGQLLDANDEAIGGCRVASIARKEPCDSASCPLELIVLDLLGDS